MSKCDRWKTSFHEQTQVIGYYLENILPRELQGLLDYYLYSPKLILQDRTN